MRVPEEKHWRGSRGSLFSSPCLSTRRGGRTGDRDRPKRPAPSHLPTFCVSKNIHRRALRRENRRGAHALEESLAPPEQRNGEYPTLSASLPLRSSVSCKRGTTVSELKRRRKNRVRVTAHADGSFAMLGLRSAVQVFCRSSVLLNVDAEVFVTAVFCLFDVRSIYCSSGCGDEVDRRLQLLTVPGHPLPEFRTI